MRYLLWIGAMAGDILMLAAMAFLLYESKMDPFVVIIFAVCLRMWWKTGGFEAWQPSVIRQYMANARRMGL